MHGAMRTELLRRDLARPLLALSAILAMHALALVFVRSAMFAAHASELGLAIAVDLTLTTGLLVFLTLRGTRWLHAGLSLTGLSAILSVALLHPPEVADRGVWVLALAELVVVGTIGSRVVLAARRVRGLATTLPLVEAIEQEAGAVVGERLGAFVANELALVAYAFGAGRKEEGFSHHREAGWSTIASALTLMLIVEGVAVHLALASWNEAVAWVVSALELYGLIWLVGDARAASKIRTTLDESTLRIRVGLRFRVDVPLAAIEGARPISPDEQPKAPLSLVGPPNVMVELGEPVRVSLFAWRRAPTRRLALRVDESEAFVHAVDSACTAHRR